MPNIRSQTVYNDGGPQAYELVASDGRTFTLTKAQAIAFYQSTSGNAASRRAQLITWFKNGIIAACGTEQIALADLDFDFDVATGSLSKANIGLVV